jgi:IPT/TIG domain
MYTAAGSRMIIAIGVLAICLAAISPTVTWAAEPVKQEKKVKKPAKARANAPTPKSPAPKVAAPIVPAPIVPAPKFASAETAGKAASCFGEAPTLDKLTPDEGKAGDRVIITGTNFGEVACLRGVSFGPGSPAQFQQTDDSIETTVPSGGKKGLVLLTVTTASGENSRPFLVK